MFETQEDISFDVALSYSASESWLARDIYHLVNRQGYSVYCYELLSDFAGGFLREHLQQVYRTSKINVILWSKSYSEQPKDAFVTMERRFLSRRHIFDGDDKALVIVSIDDTKLDPDLSDILSHRLKDQGVIGLEKIILARLRRLTNAQRRGSVHHPSGTELFRGKLHHGCSFFINRAYKSDRLGRWKRLGDVLVELPDADSGTSVYLIPSGLSNPLLRHSKVLRNDTRYLKLKKRATEEFVELWLGRSLQGAWFNLKTNQGIFQTVYSESYDRYLNSVFDRSIDV